MVSLVSRVGVVSRSEADRAFERLFQAEYQRVVTIAYRILGDAAEAEDVAQDVFYDFHRHHAPDAPYAAPWLHKAAAHTAYNAARSRARRERPVDVETHAAIDPQRALEQVEARREVREAMSRLSERSATVLMLRYGGLSYAEVAEALDVGVNQVGTLLNRAEAALRRELSRGTSR
ncbi:MAG: sigma-70 family RNA polymerase sigma factor [Anaerolineae bacterium]